MKTPPVPLSEELIALKDVLAPIGLAALCGGMPERSARAERAVSGLRAIRAGDRNEQYLAAACRAVRAAVPVGADTALFRFLQNHHARSGHSPLRTTEIDVKQLVKTAHYLLRLAGEKEEAPVAKAAVAPVAKAAVAPAVPTSKKRRGTRFVPPGTPLFFSLAGPLSAAGKYTTMLDISRSFRIFGASQRALFHLAFDQDLHLLSNISANKNKAKWSAIGGTWESLLQQSYDKDGDNIPGATLPLRLLVPK